MPSYFCLLLIRHHIFILMNLKAIVIFIIIISITLTEHCCSLLQNLVTNREIIS